MEDPQIVVETTNVAEENVAKQQTGLTDVPVDATPKLGWDIHPAHLTEQGEEAKAGLQQPDTLSPPVAHLTEQGEEVKADFSAGRDNPWPVRPTRMTPQAQATLNALKGNRRQ